jgi:hypothetical protein
MAMWMAFIVSSLSARICQRLRAGDVSRDSPDERSNTVTQVAPKAAKKRGPQTYRRLPV